MKEPMGVDALLRDWLRRARESQHSHHDAGKVCKTLNYCLGVPVLVITTVLGTAAFAAIEQEVGSKAKAWFGALSLSAAVLAALQTHFQFGERAERHRELGARYGNIRREIEQALALHISDAVTSKEVVQTLREKIDALGSEGPVVPLWIFRATLARLHRGAVAQGVADNGDQGAVR